MGTRRTFFRDMLFLGSAAVLFEPACSKTELANGAGEGPAGFSFGTGDIAKLNYLYLLEQLSAGFYLKLKELNYTGATPDEILLLGDIALHETCHREFLKTALGSNALPEISLDYSTVDFTSRSAVLATALQIEDLGIQSSNYVAGNIQSSAFITIAAEIISVEARHSSYIHELVNTNSFTAGGLTTSTSLEIIVKPQQAFNQLSAYIKTKLDTSALQNF